VIRSKIFPKLLVVFMFWKSVFSTRMKNAFSVAA
jgi:hypothetical protein